MPDPLIFLTRDDVEKIRDMQRRLDALELRRPSREADRDFPNQEVYVVRSPDGGIPALSIGTTWSSGTGTGAGAFGADVPGQAQCEVYQLAQVGGIGTPVLTPTDGQLVTVNNITSTPVPANKWVAVTRDKFGDWYALTEHGDGTAGSGETVLWANCRLNGSAVSVLADVDIPIVVQLSPSKYEFFFTKDFVKRDRFTVCGIIANNDFFYEDYAQRTSSSCVMVTASGTAPVSHFGITVHGSPDVASPPTPPTGTGTGTGGVVFPPDGCPCDAPYLCLDMDGLNGYAGVFHATSNIDPPMVGARFMTLTRVTDPSLGLGTCAWMNGVLGQFGEYVLLQWDGAGWVLNTGWQGGLYSQYRSAGTLLDCSDPSSSMVMSYVASSGVDTSVTAPTVTVTVGACPNPGQWTGTGTGATVTVACCPSSAIQPNLSVTLSQDTYPPLGPACPVVDLNLAYSVTGIVGEGWYSAPFACNGDSHQIVVFCTGTTWSIGFYINGVEFYTATGIAQLSCDPLVLSGPFDSGGPFAGVWFDVAEVFSGVPGTSWTGTGSGAGASGGGGAGNTGTGTGTGATNTCPAQVSCWSMDETSGDRLDSVSGYDLVERVSTVASVVGKVGNAAMFDGSSYLETASNVCLQARGSFTVAMWLYRTGGYDVAGKFGDILEWWLSIDAFSGKPTFYVENLGTYVEYGGAWTDNAWHFIACWYDAPERTIHMQVDNGTVYSAVGELRAAGDSPVKFGGGIAGGWLVGRIDNAQFYRRMLTPSERDDLWNGGAGLTCGGTPSTGTGGPAPTPGTVQSDCCALGDLLPATIYFSADNDLSAGCTPPDNVPVVRNTDNEWISDASSMSCGGNAVTVFVQCVGTTSSDWHVYTIINGSTIEITIVGGFSCTDEVIAVGTVGSGTWALTRGPLP